MIFQQTYKNGNKFSLNHSVSSPCRPSKKYWIPLNTLLGVLCTNDIIYHENNETKTSLFSSVLIAWPTSSSCTFCLISKAGHNRWLLNISDISIGMVHYQFVDKKIKVAVWHAYNCCVQVCNRFRHILDEKYCCRSTVLSSAIKKAREKGFLLPTWSS